MVEIGHKLVLSGCGARFPVHAGAYNAIYKHSLSPITGVACSSGGAIIGGLIAMGYSPSSILSLLKSMNLPEFMDYCWPKGFGLVYPNHSLIMGKKIDATLNKIFSMKFKDVKIPLHIFTTDFYDKIPVVFSQDTTPNETLATAIRASISIPLLMPPVKYRSMHLVDGGIMNNFPIDFFGSGEDVIGIKIVQSESKVPIPTIPQQSNPVDIVMGTIDALIASQEKEHYDDAMYARIIYAETTHGAFDFNITNQAVDLMYRDGQEAVRTHFNEKKEGQ